MMLLRRRLEPRWLLWLILGFSGLWTLAAEPVVVYLKNGDRLTGELTAQDETRVVLNSAITGSVALSRDQIERIAPVGDAATVKPATPARVATPPAVATAKPASAPAPTPAPAPVSAPVSAAALTNAQPSDVFLPGWFTGAFTNWHGNVQAGVTLGVGTTDRTTMYANATASKKWGRTISIVEYHATYGEADGVENANQMSGGTKVDVDISQNRRLYAYGQAGASYDEIRKIDLEYLGGGGMGYRVIDKPKRVLAGELGLQYEAFNYSSSPDQRTVALRLGENFTTTIEKLVVTQRLGFTPSLTDSSNYQANFVLTLSYPLFKPLTLNLNLTDQYLSQPAAGVQKNDLQVQTTVGVTF